MTWLTTLSQERQRCGVIDPSGTFDANLCAASIYAPSFDNEGIAKALALRAALRMDLDALLVFEGGEDELSILCAAAVTGHQVILSLSQSSVSESRKAIEDQAGPGAFELSSALFVSITKNGPDCLVIAALTPPAS